MIEMTKEKNVFLLKNNRNELNMYIQRFLKKNDAELFKIVINHNFLKFF